jgi:hypothetical protein
MVFAAKMLQRIWAAFEKYGKDCDPRLLETLIEQEVKALGAAILEVGWRLRMQGRPVPPHLACTCGHVQHRIGRRPITLQGVLGPVELTERYYYRCDRCRASGFWGDDLRGAGRYTQLAEERMALVGKEMPYQKASELLRRLEILEAAGSTIRKVCVRLGQRARELLDRETAEQYGAASVRPEEPAEGLAISVDGVMVGRVDPQHRRRRSWKTGRKVRGKTGLHHFFQEVKALVVFSFDRGGEGLRKTYHATQARVEEFREKVCLEACRRGAETARRLVFLGDGAPWIWKTAAECFPKAIQVLDWYHAMEHLWAVGRARFGANEVAVCAWVKKREKELWEGRVEAVLQALREVAGKLGQPDPRLKEEARERDPKWIAYHNVGYFEENQHRMDYPRYRAENLPIGSGVVESSCRHVVGDRLKRAGMRWDEEGGEDLLALRCLDLNGRWDGLWPLKVSA